jgi:hypothetical protein
VSEEGTRRYRAGQQVDDLCRACKAIRVHTVIATDGEGRVVRVVCDFCQSQHNYRGGGDGDRGGDRHRPSEEPGSRPSMPSRPVLAPAAPAARAATGEPPHSVGEGERTASRMSTHEGGEDLERLLRRVLRQELGLTPVVPAEKWRGGELVLRPGKPGLQEKKWPIDSFFHKVVMVRNRLRTLEQQVNASDLPDDAKVRLQAYVSGCYGSLTSFNVLFADEDDQFKGSPGGD